MQLFMTDLHNAGSMIDYLLDIVANDVHVLNLHSGSFIQQTFKLHHDYEIIKSLFLKDKNFQLDNGFYKLESPKNRESGNINDYFYCHVNDGNIDRIYFDSNQIVNFKILLNHESDKELQIFDMVYDHIIDYMKERKFDETTISEVLENFKDDNFEAIRYLDQELSDKFKQLSAIALYKIVDNNLSKEQDIEKNEDIEME